LGMLGVLMDVLVNRFERDFGLFHMTLLAPSSYRGRDSKLGLSIYIQPKASES